MAPSRRVWLTELSILAGFLAGAVYVTWPLAAHLPTHVGGGLGDPLLSVWLFSWGEHAIWHVPAHLFDANIFFPEASTFAFTENMLGQSVPLAPLYWVTDNGVLTMNVAMLGHFTIGAYGAYLLARELGAPRPAAVVAGCLFGFAPYRVTQVGHIHVVAVHLVPIVAALLVRVRRQPSVRWALGLGAVLALQFWSSLSGGLITLMAVGAFGLWVAVFDRRRAPRILAWSCAGVAFGMVLVAPLALVYAHTRADQPGYKHPRSEVMFYSATPGSYLSSTVGGPLTSGLNARLDAVDGKEQGDWEKHLSPGWTLSLAVVVAGVAVAVTRLRRRGGGAEERAARRREDRGSVVRAGLSFGLILIVVSFVMSLGPRLGGDPDGLMLPFEVVLDVVEGNLLRVPARFGVLVPLGLAVALSALLTGLGRRGRGAIVGLCLAGAVVEFMPTQLPEVRQVPPRGAAVRAVAGRSGAVLTLPTLEVAPEGHLVGSAYREILAIYLSTAHFRPITNGYSSFHPRSWETTVRAVQDLPGPGSLRYLRDLGVDTVIVLRREVKETRWQDSAARLADWPGVTLVAADGQAAVFDISDAQVEE